MPVYISLDRLSPGRKLAAGVAIALAGLLAAWMITSQPHRLRAPLWVALLACAVPVIGGAMVAVHAAVSAAAYRWWVVALLGVMWLLTLGLALVPRRGGCQIRLAGLAPETACLVVFSASALALLALLVMAIASARKGGQAAPRPP